uniref:Fibrinogen C-terminal domain-containing protein n=2 Tax=Macrostomum lignano TaxID=282301 RepID=A0A1I8JGQ3_9PLAT
SVVLVSLGAIFFVVSSCLAGLIIFAYYANVACDPSAAGWIEDSNQIVPFYVMENLSIPVVPGLFIASLFAGALSSVSSSLSALAATTWEDFFKPYWCLNATEAKATWINRLFSKRLLCLLLELWATLNPSFAALGCGVWAIGTFCSTSAGPAASGAAACGSTRSGSGGSAFRAVQCRRQRVDAFPQHLVADRVVVLSWSSSSVGVPLHRQLLLAVVLPQLLVVDAHPRWWPPAGDAVAQSAAHQQLRGCASGCGVRRRPLRQLLTALSASALIFGHQTLLLSLASVFRSPRCPACARRNIVSRRLLGTTILSRRSSTPSSSASSSRSAYSDLSSGWPRSHLAPWMAAIAALISGSACECRLMSSTVSALGTAACSTAPMLAEFCCASLLCPDVASGCRLRMSAAFWGPGRYTTLKFMSWVIRTSPVCAFGTTTIRATQGAGPLTGSMMSRSSSSLSSLSTAAARWTGTLEGAWQTGLASSVRFSAEDRRAPAVEYKKGRVSGDTKNIYRQSHLADQLQWVRASVGKQLAAGWLQWGSVWQAIETADVHDVATGPAVDKDVHGGAADLSGHVLLLARDGVELAGLTGPARTGEMSDFAAFPAGLAPGGVAFSMPLSAAPVAGDLRLSVCRSRAAAAAAHCCHVLRHRSAAELHCLRLSLRCFSGADLGGYREEVDEAFINPYFVRFYKFLSRSCNINLMRATPSNAVQPVDDAEAIEVSELSKQSNSPSRQGDDEPKPVNQSEDEVQPGEVTDEPKQSQPLLLEKLYETKMNAELLVVITLLCRTASSQLNWTVQRDDLSEYKLDSSVAGVRSDLECATLARPQHQAIKFDRERYTCRLYSCQLGTSGCRKCRNARNSTLPLLLVRQLDELGRTCWRTFQHRVDGSVDFYRNWTNYLTEFGQSEDRNYWMGLEAIHQLTRAGDRRVRWEMSDWNGTRYWWEDAHFAVQDASQGYRVSVGEPDVSRSNVATCSHTVGAYMNNAMFSTPDKDQDTWSSNCAVTYQGAWWYGSCHCFNPNGRYFTPPAAFYLSEPLWADGLTFSSPGIGYPLSHYYSMKTFECMSNLVPQALWSSLPGSRQGAGAFAKHQQTNNQFSPVDYVVLGVFLTASLAVGIVASFIGRRKGNADDGSAGSDEKEEFVMGGRKQQVIPVALSLLVSFNSAILILGGPAEIYFNGTMYVLSIFGEQIGCVLAALIFVPVFYQLRLTSSFEYLELRFKSRLVRLMGNFLLLINNGGLKAVIWTDVFQSVVMTAGILAIIIRGLIDLGGIGNVWQISYKYGRIEFDNLDPRVRHTVWGLVVGNGIAYSSTFGVFQASVQRYCSVKTMRQAQL